MERIISVMLVLWLFILPVATVCSQEARGSPNEITLYMHHSDQLTSLRRSLEEGQTNDLDAFEKVADDIDATWRDKSKAHHASLMLEICKPLSSGSFKNPRRYDLARRYALSALERPDEIPLITELELIGHVPTVGIASGVSSEQFSKMRREDVTLRLHAWKRLEGAVDPSWDPEEVVWGGNIAPPAATGLPAGVEPVAIKDADLRKEYEAAIERNRQKAEEYKKQYELRKWLKRYPKRAEEIIVEAYSHPPFSLEELRQTLDAYLTNKETKTRMLDTVEKNIETRRKEKPEDVGARKQ